MEHMRRIAYETVLRACGFGSLAIFCVMIGMSFEPRLAFQAGGTLTTAGDFGGNATFTTANTFAGAFNVGLQPGHVFFRAGAA